MAREEIWAEVRPPPMTTTVVCLPDKIFALREGGRIPVGEKACVTLPPTSRFRVGQVKGLLGGRLGLEVAPVARTTILECLIWPVEVKSVKIEVVGS